MNRLIVKYGLVLFVLLALLKFIEFQFFSYRFSLDVYLFLVAVVFLSIGVGFMWYLRPVKHIENTLKVDEKKLAEFSKREQQMLLFLSQGYTNKEIALSLEISPNTVKSHLKTLFQKLNVSNRTQAVAEAKSLKIIL